MCSPAGPEVSLSFQFDSPCSAGHYSVGLSHGQDKGRENSLHTSSTWWQTYMSTMVMASATGIAEQGCQDIATIETLLITMKSIMVPLQLCKGEGIDAVTTCS